ncbi:MAG: hypothetical protein JST69_09915 [Bacteroidetes bacterium]|nr:hypothetical protein [Bacteroidota bacterium]
MFSKHHPEFLTGRFMQVDPLAHMSSDLTPYHYANNNPVVFNDPSGAEVSEIFRIQ